MNELLWILLFTLLNGLVALLGVVILFLSKKVIDRLLTYLVAFSIGGLLGGALFHFIPEAIEKLSTAVTFTLLTSGILLFFLLEILLHWHHCHESHCPHPFTHLILYGDAIHNFIDGLIIAGSFIISIPFGIITAILIILHELPQEIGDFGVLIYGGFSKKKALFYNFLSQLTAVIGGLVGYFFINSQDYAAFLLPIAAGGFLYISINDLIPEVFKEKDPIKIILHLLAIIMGLLVLISAKFLAG